MYPMDTITGAGVCGGHRITWRISGDMDARELRNINAFMDDFCATWRPSGKTLVAEPRHYADLAHAWQSFTFVDGHVSDQYFHLKDLRDALGRLEEVEPRFAYAHCLAEYAVQLAGEFEDVEDVLDELEAVMVRPLAEPAADEYAVVDDAFSVQFTPEPEFGAEGQMVFIADLHPGYRDATLAMDRSWRTGQFTLRADIGDGGTELPYEILRDLRRGLDAHFSYLSYPSSAVEYYLSCAWVQELTGLLVEDPARTELIGAVRDGLEHIIARNPFVAPARVLYDALAAAAETGNDDEVADYANALYHWIPRDFRPNFPEANTAAANRIKGELFREYAERGIGFARVVSRQPAGEAPSLRHFAADFLGPDGDADDLPYPNCFLIQDIESAAGPEGVV